MSIRLILSATGPPGLKKKGTTDYNRCNRDHPGKRRIVLVLSSNNGQ
jgi:hypothetical protein